MNAKIPPNFWNLFDERNLRESWVSFKSFFAFTGDAWGDEGSRHCVDTCYEDYIKDAVCSLYAVCESE